MTQIQKENEVQLAKAEAALTSFGETKDPEELEQVSGALQNLLFQGEVDPEQRERALRNWLKAVEALDQGLDPEFDPQDVPERFVEPPVLNDGTALRPGADPSKIKDPELRAAYEKAIAENNVKLERYARQTALHRLNADLLSGLSGFLDQAYASDGLNLEEIQAAIEDLVSDSQRKEQIRGLIP